MNFLCRRVTGSQAEHKFLSQHRTAEKERQRLAKITKEFEMGFKKLGKIGPAITVFGSARFKPGEPFYELSRKAGNVFAKGWIYRTHRWWSRCDGGRQSRRL